MNVPSGFYVIMALIAAVLVRIGWLTKRAESAEKQLLNDELKRKEDANAKKVTDDNSGKSDADIVRDAIKRG